MASATETGNRIPTRRECPSGSTEKPIQGGSVICSRRWCRTSRGCWRTSRGCSRRADSTSRAWRSARPRTRVLSRITVVVMGDDRHLEQVRKQLEKIVTVVKVHDISRRGLRRAGPDADQDQGPTGLAAGDHSAGTDFPGPHPRREPRPIDDRDFGAGEEDRSVHRAGPPLRDPGAGAHRADCPGAGRRAARGRFGAGSTSASPASPGSDETVELPQVQGHSEL